MLETIEKETLNKMVKKVLDVVDEAKKEMNVELTVESDNLRLSLSIEYEPETYEMILKGIE